MESIQRLCRALWCHVFVGHDWGPIMVTPGDRAKHGCKSHTARLCSRCGHWSPKPLPGQS